LEKWDPREILHSIWDPFQALKNNIQPVGGRSSEEIDLKPTSIRNLSNTEKNEKSEMNYLDLIPMWKSKNGEQFTVSVSGNILQFRVVKSLQGYCTLWLDREK
jgi:hypothetical protein